MVLRKKFLIYMRSTFVKKMTFATIIIGQITTTALATEDDLNQRIDSLEKRLQTVQKSLANVNNHKEEDAYKDLLNEIKFLRSEIERLDNRVTENSITLKEIEKSDSKDKSKITTNSRDQYILNNISKEIARDNNQDIQQNSDKSNEKIVANQYQEAYLIFRKKDEKGKNNYDAAQEAFNAFVKKYPNHPLAGNAFYWLGQIQFDLGNYNKAAIFYLNGYKINSSSGRALDNLFGLSKALTKLGKDKEACSSLNQIFNDFSQINSDIKQELDELYKINNCSSE